MFFYGFDNDGNKLYYDTDAKSPIDKFQVLDDDEVDLASASSELTFGSLDEELSYIGFTEDEIQKIKQKIDNVSNSNTSVGSYETQNENGETVVKTDGTLVKNSALALKNTTEFQKALIEIEKTKLSIMTASNEIEKKKLEQMDYNLIMQGQIYSELYDFNKNIKAQTEAIKKLKLTADIGNFIQDVTVDTTALAEANQKIAEGVESQKAVNEKMLEHYNYLKDGSTNVKDSAGNVIKPREVEAKNNAEHHIYKQSQNTFNHAENFQKVLEQLEPILNGNSSNNGTGGSGSNTSNDCNYSDDETGLLKLLCTLKTFDLKKFETDSNLNLFSKGVNNG